MTQQEIFPLRILRVDPYGLSGVDQRGICFCEDGGEYVLKDGEVNKNTPHNEWFCTHLAELCGIHSPPCKILENNNGDLVFGSRWEGGLTPPNWWDLINSGAINIPHIGPILSRVYVFDNFVYNTDRHSRNFLAREQRRSHQLIAFDYSRAWLFHPWPHKTGPLPRDCNTRKLNRGLKTLLNFSPDLKIVKETVDKITKIDSSKIEKIIDEHPSGWISRVQKREILDWWKGDKKLARLQEIEEGIRNGTFL